MTEQKKKKALVLFSGGLDSRIAVKLLQEQKNIEVETIFLKLPFGGGCCGDIPCIINFNQTQGVKLHIVDVTQGPLFEEYLNIIKKPKFGTGVGLNPCKDCKIFMLKQGKILADKIGADIIVTGEVVGQRPMSQLEPALNLTEQEAGLKDELLRPLSAKLLPETKYEKDGTIDRSKLLDIQGRQRKKQIDLANQYKIKYPNPGGGCLLCEKSCAVKMTDLFQNKEVISPQEVKLINVGRHFRKSGKIIIGRDAEENALLEALQEEMNYKKQMPETIGPTAIYENQEDLETVKQLIKAYSKEGSQEEKDAIEKYRIKF